MSEIKTETSGDGPNVRESEQRETRGSKVNRGEQDPFGVGRVRVRGLSRIREDE